MDGKKSLLCLCTLIIITLSGCIEPFEQGATTTTPQEKNTTISIACWNLQIFGPSKASNTTLLSYYATHLDDYDVFIIQEIRDASGEAIQTFSSYVPEYDYILSNRAGQSSSKEQYAIFYSSQLTLLEYTDYQQDYQATMQRPPFKATFQSNNWTFTLYTIHTQPDLVSNDLDILENIIASSDDDVMIIGDLNADGSYYNEEQRQHFTDWKWVITNDMDTTVAASDNTYDRIIINTEAENNYLSSGIMNEVNKNQSDHYLVYAVFSNAYS